MAYGLWPTAYGPMADSRTAYVRPYEGPKAYGVWQARDFDFLFGEANLDKGTGVFSFARCARL